jgi:hypothetical protein
MEEKICKECDEPYPIGFGCIRGHVPEGVRRKGELLESTMILVFEQLILIRSLLEDVETKIDELGQKHESFGF